MTSLKSNLSKLPNSVKISILVLIPLILVGCSSFGIRLGTESTDLSGAPDNSQKAIQPTPEAIQIPSDVLDEQDVLINLYERANPSVVNLTIYQLQDSVLIPASQGSGFVYDSNGNIITNAHVVNGADAEGEFIWAWLGVQGGDLTPAVAEAMSLSEDRGAYILAILPNGPADMGGLKGADDEVVIDGRRLFVGGDAIIAIDERPVRSFDDLILNIALFTDPGQEVELTILRTNGIETVTVRLEARPQDLNNIQLP